MSLTASEYSNYKVLLRFRSSLLKTKETKKTRPSSLAGMLHDIDNVTFVGLKLWLILRKVYRLPHMLTLGGDKCIYTRSTVDSNHIKLKQNYILKRIILAISMSKSIQFNMTF